MKYLDHLLTERDCSVMTFNRPRLTASLYALMSISFWGVSFVSTKAVLGKLDPYSLLVIRFGIGALFLSLLLVLQRHRLHISIKYVPHLMVLGILGVFVHQVLQATALLTINASAAGWLISFSPVFTVILSILFLHERINITKAAGMVLAITGVLIITSTRSGQSFQFAMNIGFLLMILRHFKLGYLFGVIKKFENSLSSSSGNVLYVFSRFDFNYTFYYPKQRDGRILLCWTIRSGPICCFLVSLYRELPIGIGEKRLRF
jgi:drug/metabolite transporter (DMT)-like permease